MLQIHAKPELSIRDLAWTNPDLRIPPLSGGRPHPGARTVLGSRELHHVLYLPEDWKRGQAYHLLVEFPGNGPNPLRFRSSSMALDQGLPEDTKLGYGL